ncbi:MAG: hypothetical protein EA352_10390 [Gemmatimonadales bacterium]|nr:MAG: hypothetical protein EA352_10390 [Gemmatimonadales bacterium]
MDIPYPPALHHHLPSTGDLVDSVIFGDPDAPVNLLLELLGDRLRLARASVLRVDRPSGRVGVAHEWQAAGIEPTAGYMEGIPLHPFRWLADAAAGRGVVQVDDVAQLPSEAQPEVAFLRNRATTAFMAVLLQGEAGEGPGLLLLEGVTGPRPWLAAEAAAAGRLARVLERELRRIRTEANLLRSEERYHAVLDLAGLGAWEWIPGTGGIHLSDGLLQVLGWAGEDNLQPVPRWLRALHPDDRKGMRSPVPDAENSVGRDWVREVRVRLPGGEWSLMQETGEKLGSAHGPASCVIGVLHRVFHRTT